MNSAELRSEVLAVCARMAQAGVMSFWHSRIAGALGPEFGRGGVRESDLRRAIAGLVADGALRQFDHGVTGLTVADLNGLTLPQAVADVRGLRRAFFDAGGVMFIASILKAVGVRGDEVGERRIRRALDRSTLCRQGLPIPGYEKAWALTPAERRRVPVPGRIMLIDVQLEAADDTGEVPSAWAARDRLVRRRREIGEGLRRAREAAGLAADGLAHHGAGEALARSLSHGAPGWWSGAVAVVGEAGAAATALREIEDGDADLLDALDVAAWVQLGAWVGVDPAALSRGQIRSESQNPRGVLAGRSR